jgi:response regulator NasT
MVSLLPKKIGKIKPLPIVLVTANTEAETIERARLAGVKNYVVKPVRAEQLFAAVDLAIHQFVELLSLREEVSQLKETLESRKLIDRVKGVLIKRGMDEPQAFRRLQKLAMDKRKSLRAVAEAIVLTEDCSVTTALSRGGILRSCKDVYQWRLYVRTVET